MPDGRINVPGNRLELNARMAVALGAPVLMVVDAGEGMGPDDLANKALVARNGLEEQRAEVLGVIVNKASLFSASMRSHRNPDPSTLDPCIVKLMAWLCRCPPTSTDGHLDLHMLRSHAPDSALYSVHQGRSAAHYVIERRVRFLPAGLAIS